MHCRTNIATVIATLSALVAIFSTQLALAEDEPASGDRDDQKILVDYEGQLQDADGNPISGVFPLKFNIYTDSKAAEALWSERQYVAVVDGTYKVPLGRKSTLNRENVSGNRWIGVELVGEGEILRDKLRLQESQIAANDAEGDSGTGVDTSKTRELLEKARKSDQIAFADIAERAVGADKAKHAETADKVGSMTAKEIERLSNLALERLGEHIADPKAHKASGGKLGDRERVMNSVGGPGGNSYERHCPPGFVVTGIKGGSGRVVDSISIICQRIQ